MRTLIGVFFAVAAGITGCKSPSLESEVTCSTVPEIELEYAGTPLRSIVSKSVAIQDESGPVPANGIDAEVISLATNLTVCKGDCLDGNGDFEHRKTVTTDDFGILKYTIELNGPAEIEVLEVFGPNGRCGTGVAVAGVDLPSPPLTHLLITEVMYDPLGTTDSPEEQNLEYIEIYNPTISTRDLNNWRIRDQGNQVGSGEIVFSGVTIGSGQRLLIARHTGNPAWFAEYPGVTPDLAFPLLFPMENGGDWLQLVDDANFVQDEMAYEAGVGGLNPKPIGWCSSDAPSAGDRDSVDRIDETTDFDDCLDWASNQVPTPGNINL